MLEARERVRERVRVAEIMSVSANPFRHVLVVDKGTSDDVYNGQAIVDSAGVVGQVIDAGVASSQCLLISDPGPRPAGRGQQKRAAHDRARHR